MRKLNNPMPAGGAPFNNEDLNDVFQTEIWEALQATLSAYDSDSEGVIVSGCVVSANASNFDMTEGIVYLNGEFMRVDAVTNLSFPRYIKAATPTNVTRTFENLSTSTFIIEKKAQVSATADGSGQEITISTLYSSLYRRFNFLVGNYSVYRTSAGVENNRKFLTKTIEIGDWNMDSTDVKNVAHGLSNYKSARAINAIIRDDSDTAYLPINRPDLISAGSNSIAGNVGNIDSTNIVLERATGAFFDTTDYDATSFNRGWVTIQYEA